MTKEFTWNKPFKLVMQIKHEYIKRFGLDTMDFKIWVNKLNNDDYNKIFNCLQVNQHNNLLLIRYGIADMQDSLWVDSDSIYRECRSLVIDIDKEEIVLCPFRKFFNINEVEETQLDNIKNMIDNAKIVEFTNKLDGSMQSARYYNDEFIMSGSMALNTEQSWRLKDGYTLLTNNHKQMIRDNPNYTFIFEYIRLKDAHVVIYSKQQEGLYLIGMRDIYNGKELYYKDIQCIANKYNVPMTTIENISLQDILIKMTEYRANEKEGWVLNIDGLKVKIKCDDYIHLHKLLDKYSSINIIIQNIADNKLDDMMSKVPPIYHDNIKIIINKIIEYIDETEHDICIYFDKAPKHNIKDFMIWVTHNCPKSIQGYVRCKYFNQSYNVLKKSHNNYKKSKDLNIQQEDII